MIVKSHLNIEIGKLVKDCKISDCNGNYHDMPFLILRKATKQEYLDYWTPQGAGCIGLVLDSDNFYEVSVD